MADDGMTLDALRAEIDRLDDAIVRLLDQRARCASEVGRLKREIGMRIYEPGREAVVIAHVKAVNAGLDGPLTAEAIERLYERVMDEARRIQRVEIERHTGGASAPETES
ncbi:MAG: chorismate mutase [Acidobacteria bacterium]|nr:chorismate mutase [Acidobacteriota bacterium]